MFYSGYDTQCGRYMSTGRNSKTRQECVDALTEFFLQDSDPEDRKIGIPESEREEFVACNGIGIEEHAEEIEED